MEIKKYAVLGLLIAVVLLTVIAPAVTAGSGDQWHLSTAPWFSSGVMYKNNTTQTGGETDVFYSSNVIWQADEVAETDVTFPDAGWPVTLQLSKYLLPSPVSSVRIQLGSIDADEDFTPAHDPVALSGNNLTTSWQTYNITLSPGSFTVPEGSRLAFRILNSSSFFIVRVRTGQDYSRIEDPAGSPGYPLPEKSSLVMLAVGIVCTTGLMGFMWFRQQRKALRVQIIKNNRREI